MSKYNLTDIFEQYQIGSGWTSDFDYDGMLNAGLKVNTETPIETLKKLFDDFEDVNYHREAEHLSYAIDALEDNDIFDANGRLNDFHIEIEKTMRDQGMDTSSDLAAFMASKMEEGDKKDKIARIKESVLKEARVDREVAERIEGLLNRELKRKFLFAFEDLYDDLIEEDPFHVEDVINHLSNEMFKRLKSFQDTGDKLAGLEEDTAMSGAIADEEEAGAIGTHLAEEEGKVSMKDVVLAIIKDTNATNPEVQMYIDSLTNDIKLNGKEAYEDYEVDDYIEDFREYINNKSLQEHFGRFMKDYQ
jgi:hypothetical protein